MDTDQRRDLPQKWAYDLKLLLFKVQSRQINMQQRLALLKIPTELLQEILRMEKLVRLSLSESHRVVTQIQVHNIARVLVETSRQSMHVLCRKTTP